jgi:hypothetical protein
MCAYGTPSLTPREQHRLRITKKKTVKTVTKGKAVTKDSRKTGQ